MNTRDNSIALALADVGAETVQRWKDRGAAIAARIDEGKRAALAERAGKASSKQAKIVLLRQMADMMTTAGKGLAPCDRGCHHCCNMATLVSVQEAETIARETGAKLAVPARFNDFGLDGGRALQQRYAGVPCTFLVKGQCAIYAQRPLACRMHVTVADDNRLCEIEPNQPVRCPTLSTLRFDNAIAEALGGAERVRFADVREFFPQGVGANRCL